MSSSAVRTKFETFFAAEFPSEKVAVMDGGYENLRDFLAGDPGAVGYPRIEKEPWIGLQYIPNDEEAVSVPANNTTGKYRETGLIFIHVVDIAKLAVGAGINTRCEAIRNKLRGQNISGLRVLSVSPQNFAPGATLDFEGGGYISASMTLEYSLDINL